MLKKRSLHKDMADVNVYTARRLKDMALSLGGLAQAFADEIGADAYTEDAASAAQKAKELVA